MATTVGGKGEASDAVSLTDKFTGHVVPTGLTVKPGNVVTVYATIVFTPVPEEAPTTGVGRGALDEWPQWIDERIGRGELTIAGRFGGGTNCYPARSTHGPNPPRLTKGGGKSTDANRSELLKSATELWKSWFSDDGVDRQFKGLRGLLCESRTCRANTVHKDILQDETGIAPDVIGVPRAELARRLTLARARDLMESATSVLSESDAGTIAKDRAARRANECCDAAIANRPWSTGPKEGEVKDVGLAQKYSPYRYEKPPEVEEKEVRSTREQLANVLRAERLWMEQQLREKLQAHRVAASQVADEFIKLNDSAKLSPEERLKCLCDAVGKDACAPIGAIAGQVLAKPDAFREGTDAELALHVASGLPDHTPPPLGSESQVRLRWHMLQGMHAIARALQLIVDIEFDIELSDLERATVKEEAAPLTAFGEFSIDGEYVASPRLWTLTKLFIPDGRGGEQRTVHGTCWPSTTGEWLIAACKKKTDTYRTTGILEQIDGVVDMDAQVPTSTRTTARRYDVISLDVGLAAEAETKRQRAIVTLAEIEKGASGAMPAALKEGELGEIAEESNLMTAGLQIVDRSRQSSVVREFIASCNAESERVVDAVQLSIGYRIDVGVVSGPRSKQRIWRSLVERRISYSSLCTTSGKTSGIDRLVDAFSPRAAGKGGAREIDAAILAPGTRLLQNAERKDLSGAKTAFSEEILTVWGGDPLGQSCGAASSQAERAALPVSQKTSLPRRSMGGHTPHRLRIGRAYAFGLRTVLLGGISPALSRASKLYDSKSGAAGMAYPASMSEYQRFLRHERIGPPIVATDARLLVREFGGPRGGIDGKEMVVRSAPKDDVQSAAEGWRFSPNETSRILFAPTVSLDFATLHGVFDKDAAKSSGKAPAGGLGDIDYDADWGGFPVFDPKGPAIEQSIRGTWRKDERPLRNKDGTIIQPGKTPSGMAAVRGRHPKSVTGKRALQFYPDPAARHMLIALRRPGPRGKYLEGDAIRVSVYPGAPATNAKAETFGYPDARPIILKVKTLSGSRDPLRSYDDVRKRAGIESDAKWPVQSVVDSAGPAVVVTIFLAPSEDFEVDAWMAPDETHLRAWFDHVEALALLFSTEVENETRARCCELAASLTVSDRSSGHWRVRRGEASIEARDIRQASSLVHQALMKRPVPEIASVRRLRVLHAVSRPSQEPAFADQLGDQPAARVLRLPQANLRRVLEKNDEVVGSGEEVSAEGAVDLMVIGKARIDPETTETIELRVTAPALHGSPFDDAERGRSNHHRARGIWDRTVIAPDGKALEPVKMGACSSDDGDTVSYMEELFGFDVRPDGRVVLPRRESVLATWPIERDAGETVDFLQLSRQFVTDRKVAADAQTAVVSPIEAVFPDTRARRLALTLAATSRTARHIPERLAYRTDEEAEADQGRFFRESSPIGVDGKIVIKATARPAALSTKSLLPAFAWGNKADGMSRRTRIRIRLRRPWWTSGEDERLGVVVWPPNLGSLQQGQSPNRIASGIVQRTTPMAPGDGQLEIDLHQNASGVNWRNGFFTDADLGSGGAYVTRWGSDPILSSGDVSWIIPYEAFRDLRDVDAQVFARPIDMIATEGRNSGELWPIQDRYLPRFVENVLMPIPNEERTSAADKNKAKDGAAKNPDFMMVSLVTYAPRFDPDFEHWYVDLDLDTGIARDPFVRLGLVRFQPHADRHLQVSEPVCEWVQVVSYARDVTVKRRAAPQVPKGSSRRDWVRVTVNNASAHIAGTGRRGDCSSPNDGPPAKFRATLIECRRMPSGQVTERVALSDLSADEHAAAGLVTHEDEKRRQEVVLTSEAKLGTSNLWDCALPLPRAELAGPDVSYAVLVEEFMEAEPGTYSNEPIKSPEQINKDERIIQTGPRFAVRLEVE